ncbi:MAG TPA: dihydrofolate reductase family protein [Solirubrobacteraceae bacterium]|nr:dihydrofolate reductase family protein [Solirubrobacteraceae bacterium]
MSSEPAQRKLILYMSMSLDGFAARRDGTMDWLGEAQPYADRRQRAVAELLGQTGLLVLGRRAGQDMAQAWPSSHSATGKYMNTLPKVVFSSTVSDLEWSNTRVTDRSVQEEVPELKGQPGKDIVVFGGASFARSLAAHGLIDEYRINVQPVALGDGLPLLHGLPEPQRLELVSSTAWADGPITQTYVPR